MTSKEAASLYRNMKRTPPLELADEEQIRKHKYNARRKSVGDIVFDSTLEAEAYRVLAMWQKGGALMYLQRQVPFTLKEGFRDQSGKWHRPIKYVVDFSFIGIPVSSVRTDDLLGTIHELTAPRIAVDVKGYPTPAFRIKEKLFRAAYPDIDLQIWDRAKVKELARL